MLTSVPEVRSRVASLECAGPTVIPAAVLHTMAKAAREVALLHWRLNRVQVLEGCRPMPRKELVIGEK